MSLNARRHEKSERKLCPCGRKAGYYSIAKRSWQWRPDHPLCPACHQSVRDRAAVSRFRRR